eukprot:UN00332
MKGSKNMVFGGANASWEKVIGVAAYFIVSSYSTAVVLTAVNYSDHLLLSHGVVNGMNAMLRNDGKMVECKDDIFVKIKD